MSSKREKEINYLLYLKYEIIKEYKKLLKQLANEKRYDEMYELDESLKEARQEVRQLGNEKKNLHQRKITKKRKR